KDCIIGKSQFEMMKPTSLLINTARGRLMDYKALRDALSKGLIGGAVLDVLGKEPYAFYCELSSLPNVTITPHMAGVSRETVARGIQMTGNEIYRFLKGQPLAYQI
ncbi:MAG: hydroxyacid dehydrogenase, partial [Clostridiales bacterium]|nr:hydroxyacid dehydrogenase [Clostridiales bacterium]